MKKNILLPVSLLSVIGGTIVCVSVFSGIFGTKIPENTAANVFADVEIPQESSIESEKISGKENEKRVLACAVDYNSATKDDIFHMMLNSVDYFDKASGAIICPSDDINLVNVVQFQTVLSESQSYTNYKQCYAYDLENISLENVLSSECVYENEIFCGENQKINTFANDKTYTRQNGYVTRLSDIIEVPDEERISADENGIPIYSLEADPTNVLMSSVCLFPQEMTFGFLADKDLWDITDIVEYDGKTCYLIEGKTTPDYGAKLNVSRFEFLVDTNTGVLVNYKGYDENDELSDFMYTENLQFEDKAESVKLFSSNLVEEYKNLSE